MKTGLFLAATIFAAACAITANAGPPPEVNDAAVTETRLPRALSDFAFFADGPGQVPANGVTPYRLNTPLYSDGATKLRFLYMPAGTQAISQGEGLLSLPVGSALIKTFAFGEGADRRLIETRVLLHRADGWLALPYKWNDEQTDAKLAIAGARVDLTTPRGEQISYRVPNKNQCKECHGLNGEVIPIGPKVRNLSHDWQVGLVTAGLLNAAPDMETPLPMWEDRMAAKPEAAARAYLDVNCAHCHQPGATASNSGLDLRWEQTLPGLIGIGKRPVAAGRGSGGLLFDIVPGKPEESILVHRMKSNEPGVAMPELGKSTVDEEGVAAVTRWIEGI
ncbi:SO2930 family diheme c-type cytochrome [Altererythrobacter sp. ZODW24]|uniref:SO2930 family diheme c-type cytochrome n=1 Tax=Altererythrobacter sp. ZODW24 TaxID=2185142 RepID=UPI000DF76562|nr:SO2930 family diheme c-type cytochrome [Altererythrobacter sp. ZODW24]